MRTARLPINDAAEHAAVQNVWRGSSRRKVTDSIRGNTFHGGITVVRYQVQKENRFYSPELTF